MANFHYPVQCHFIESKQMDIKFLTKQLILMSNIAKIYHKKSPYYIWKKFHDLFIDKRIISTALSLSLKSAR
ncbi:MAG: hypothetical protein SRB2_00245 [Desulfobacteraceae bacterium Eth-SRB2]|nr:MAG: hypothetical protein SRB2_00245 [Desulfobacteraceae bacterium Eth-SRB2]